MNGVLLLLFGESCAGEIAVFLKGLRSEFDTIHEKDDFIGVIRRGYELRSLKGRHRFSGTGRVPNIPAELIVFFPFRLGDFIGNRVRRVILIAPHDL